MPLRSAMPPSHLTILFSETTKIPWLRSGGGVIGRRMPPFSVSHSA
jgi:hypothetical protein